jgi:hypothetical protein
VDTRHAPYLKLEFVCGVTRSSGTDTVILPPRILIQHWSIYILTVLIKPKLFFIKINLF